MAALIKRLISLPLKSIWVRRFLRWVIGIKDVILFTFYSFYKVDPKLIVFESYMGRAYSCSPRAIYEEILKSPEFNNYKFIWIFKNPTDKLHLFNAKRTRIIRFKSIEYYKAYCQAKYWITNSMLPQAIVKKEGQFYIQCWHGTPLKRLRCDIIPETKSAKNSLEEIINNNNLDARRYDYFVSPSRFASEKFISAFNLKALHKENIILEVGYPRNDFLFKYTNEDVHKIKTNLGIPENKKVILYAPTWRDNQHDLMARYTYELKVNFDYLKDKLSKDYVILFRPHYFIANSFNFDKYKGFVYDVSKTDDINELYIISDVLITDYSSVFFDYANLKRPIIFYMYDRLYYQNELRGFYIDLDELPGEIVEKDEDIVRLLNNLDGYIDKYQDKYKLFNAKFNYLDNGKASIKFLEKVFVHDKKSN